MEKLTEKQLEYLRMIERFITVKKYPPSIREIGKMMGSNSPATVYNMLERLKKKKYIDYEKGKTRSITIKYNRIDLEKGVNMNKDEIEKYADLEYVSKRFRELNDFIAGKSDLIKQKQDLQERIDKQDFLLKEQGKELKELKKRNKEIYDGYISATQELTEYAEENERLNNIINELEQWLKEHSIIDYNCSDIILHEQMALNTAFEYLQILKENK